MSTSPLFVSLSIWGHNQTPGVEVVFDNFIVNAGEVSQASGAGDEVGKPQPTVNMGISKLKIDLEKGNFKIKGVLDVTDPDFEALVLDPRFRLLLELETGGTDDEPKFSIVGEDQIQLTTDKNWEKLKYTEHD